MSLDVYLSKEETRCHKCGTIIEEGEILYSSNITHNLIKMSAHAGIYMHLWRPYELDIKLAKDLIKPLSVGLQKMKDNPEHYKTFNSTNGWGMYKHFIPWIEEYLDACIENPNSLVTTST